MNARTYANWHEAPNRFNTLAGGSRRRLETYRRNLADSLKTIRGCRTPEAAEAFIASAGYTSALNHRGAWMGDAHGIGEQLQRAAAEGRDTVCAPWGLVDGWRDVGDTDDVISTVRHRGWYSDAEASEKYRGHVWQLPARDGSPQYVAGYVEDMGGKDGTRASGYVVLECARGSLVTYDDKEDAARAGDELARIEAEKAREYSERWQAARRHDDERDEARNKMKGRRAEARLIVAALRELPSVVEGVADRFSIARAQLSAGLDDAHGDMREAIGEIREHTEAIEQLDMTGEF